MSSVLRRSLRQTNQRSIEDSPTIQPFVSYTNTEFETRSTPNDLCCALQGLTAAQISDIKDMGFENITSFNIHNVPTGLGHWLLVNYDHNRNVLNIGSHVIEITPSKVYDILGVPMGKITVSENKRARKKDVIREEWRNQFFQVQITVKHVLEKLKSYRKGGTLFKLNFLVLFNSIMGETTKGAMVNQKFLASIVNEGNISNMDWCSYVITCLKRTKEGWNGNEPYNGPLTFLAVLYAHELQLRGSPEKAITPAIKYVKTDCLVGLESSLNDKGPCLIDNVEAQIQSVDEGQTAMDENVNASQNEEAEDRFQSTNPAGDGTQNVMDGRINRCNQLELLRDENLLDDDVIELIEPKQEECELDESASHMSDSLSSRQSGVVCVKGYKVNRGIAPTLIDILKKHGNIAAACVLKSDPMKSSILESVCGLFKQIQTDNINNMSEAESVVSDAKAVNINVSWLEALMEGVRKRKEANKEYCLCLEMKAGITMARRSARKELGDRRAELEASHKRFKETERCVEALHIVGKHLIDHLLESEADPDGRIHG